MSDDPQITKRFVVTAITDVFVLDPNLRGRYIRTDRSVIEVECPQCKAKLDEPCFRYSGTTKTKRRYSGLTHTARRTVATSRRWHDKRRPNP